MTEEEAAAEDEALKLATAELLKSATDDTGVFAIELGGLLPEPLQNALERMQRSGWVRLIDVSAISTSPGRLYRVFQASGVAMTWFRKRQ